MGGSLEVDRVYEMPGWAVTRAAPGQSDRGGEGRHNSRLELVIGWRWRGRDESKRTLQPLAVGGAMNQKKKRSASAWGSPWGAQCCALPRTWAVPRQPAMKSISQESEGRQVFRAHRLTWWCVGGPSSRHRDTWRAWDLLQTPASLTIHPPIRFWTCLLRVSEASVPTTLVQNKKPNAWWPLMVYGIKFISIEVAGATSFPSLTSF